MKILNLIAISALIAGASPVVFDALPTGFDDTGAAFSKNNGNKGGENRGGSGRGRENSGQPAWAGQGNANSAGGASARAAKPMNVHAQLKGLNSLNRNINGLMNSADPKMDMFREFIRASADYEEQLDLLAEAFAGFDPDGSFQATLESLGLTMPTSAGGLGAMAEQLMALAAAPIPLESDFVDATAYQQALESWMISTAVAANALAQYQNSDLFGAARATGEAEAASSEAAMINAMIAGLNATGAGPVTVEDMTPEMIEWVASQLGVGDAEGLIDAYLAQVPDMEDPEGPAESDADEGEADS